MLAPPANCKGNVVLRSPRRRTWGRGVEVVGRDTPSTSRHPRPPSSVIPGFPPPSSPTSLLRHPRPRSGTYARVILAPDPKPITPPSFRPPSRYPWAGRGNHPPHPHPSTVVPAKERPPVPRYGAGTQGTGAETTTTVIPAPLSVTPLPSCRRRNVPPYPDTGPVPRGRARQPPQPSSPTNTPSPLTVVPAKERHPVPRYGAGTQGTGAATTTTDIPHQHPLTPLPSCRRRPVPRYGPVPKGRARKPPQP